MTKNNTTKFRQNRVKRKVPTILSKDEIKHLLGQFASFEEYIFFLLQYSCGLNEQEVLALEVRDIDGKNSYEKMIKVRRYDRSIFRCVPLPDYVYKLLQKYWLTHEDPRYVFPKNERIRSMKYALKKAVSRSGLTQPISRLTFRFSYAAHLYESGVAEEKLLLYLGSGAQRTINLVVEHFYRQKGGCDEQND